ncbi:leucyl aminopeptidase, partial [Brevibacterium sp. 5221]
AARAVGAAAAVGSAQRIPSPAGLAAGSVVLAGIGADDADTAESTVFGADRLERLRRAAGSATRALTKGESAALALPARTAEEAEAVTVGALLGAYRYVQYRSGGDADKGPAALTVLAPKAAAPGVERGTVMAAATAGARDWVNEPPLDLYPESFAAAVTQRAKDLKVKATVLDDRQLAAQGYGGLTGVGRGSERGPRLVKLEYAPRRARAHLALVGKGITFDSGGLSLKPAASMEEMKSDMGGAAAAAQALFAIAELGLPVRVTAWLALAENMPGGGAQRPSDVIRIYGGKTVEVTNTDAEGRLVLADALVAAQEDKPDLIVDIATLTGAQIVALGDRVSGVMGTAEARNRIVLASELSGEQMWPMPFPEEIRAGFDSTVADLKNAGPRAGGMLAAGIFLSEFVADGQQWAHVDIAGPSFNSHSGWGYTPAAGTGVPVRTLVETAAALSRG